jgi:hypothetical protein
MTALLGGGARAASAVVLAACVLVDATGAALVGVAAAGAAGVTACDATSEGAEESDVAACETCAWETVFFVVMGTSWVETLDL